MKFSAQQEAAIAKVGSWLKMKYQPFFYLAGYAGTGKTTIARHLAGLQDGNVKFAAFTGKAASVMRRSGCSGASTIHSLIYFVDIDTKTGRYKTRLTNRNVKDASLIVIDECSMVNEEVGNDLLSFGIPVLVLGDPAQLPPVDGSGFFTSGEPDFMLTEVHRQASGNPIVRLATAVREDRTPTQPFSSDNYPGFEIVRRRDFDELRLKDFDTVIVGTNRSRRAKNALIRGQIGFDRDEPMAKDTVICLRNDGDLGIANGQIFTIASKVTSKRLTSGKVFNFNVHDKDTGIRADVSVWEQFFRGAESEIPMKLRLSRQEFDFGYAITAHKSQGSQWGKVCVFDDSFIFKGSERKWLYTAVTRASNELTLVI